MEVRFSISIPQLDYDRFDEAGLKDYLARAEELGFEGGWTMEQVVGARAADRAAAAARLRRRLHHPAAAGRRGPDHLAA